MRTQRNHGETIIGVGLVIAGILFLLSAFGVIQDLEWWRLLPGLLIIWGVLQFATSRPRPVLGPAILVVVGIVLLLATTGVVSWGIVGRLWPLVLVFIGITILVGRRRVDRLTGEETSGDTVGIVSVLGDNVRRLTSQSFRGGDVTSILASAKADLRDAMTEGGAVVNVTVILGSVEIWVPEEWEVDLAPVVLLGDVKDKRLRRATATGAQPQLRIVGLVLMGSVEIKG